MPDYTHKDKETIIELGNIEQTYILVTKLEGRGQKGLGAFYETENGSKSILIKADDPATCVMEGSAHFVVTSGAIPEQLKDTVNYASMGVYLNEKQQKEVISIQNKVVTSNNPEHKVIPWDTIVYGHKRNPKTLYSEESYYPEHIKQNITAMLPTTQWQLAGGIFSSNLAGDESLHVGQFMAVKDSQDNIIAIKRIDLGARERHAVARKEQPYDPYHTSIAYSTSGQWEKDYINFLLSVEDLKRKYILLWSLAEIDGVKIKVEYTKVMMEAITHLPEEHKQAAYDNIIKSINMGATNDFKPKSSDLNGKINDLVKYLAELASKRATESQKIVLKDLDKIFDNDQSFRQQFIDAYRKNDFQKIDYFLEQLQKKPQSIENDTLALYICDAAILMTMADAYKDKQSFYVNQFTDLKLKSQKFILKRLELTFSLFIEQSIGTSTFTQEENKNFIEDVRNIIAVKYNANDYEDLSLIVPNELFSYILSKKSELYNLDTPNKDELTKKLDNLDKLIDPILQTNLNFTKFGTIGMASNSKNQNRTEGALLLAIKAGDYTTLNKLLDKRTNQYFADVNIAANVKKTIGSVDRKDKDGENIFHHLFKNWDKIPQDINKAKLLTNLIKLLVIEKNSRIVGTQDIASVFTQQNVLGKTPLHIILADNNRDAWGCLNKSIEELNKKQYMAVATVAGGWSLAHFINFAQEADKNKKNFLDYAYENTDSSTLTSLLTVLADASEKKLVNPNDRNKILCSNYSPLSSQEKDEVIKKTITKGILWERESGKPGFMKGKELWLNKMRYKKSEECRSESPSSDFTII